MKNAELKIISITTTKENYNRWTLALSNDGFRSFTPWAIHVLNKYVNDKLASESQSANVVPAVEAKSSEPENLNLFPEQKSTRIKIYKEPQREVIATGSGYTITKLGGTGPRGFGGCHMS